MSESVDEEMGNTHPLTNSSTHLLKDKIAVKTIKNIKWEIVTGSLMR